MIASSCFSTHHFPSSRQLTHAPSGTLFIADKQVEGKGRSGNTWESPAGCLMFSFKFTVTQASRLPFLQYLVSLDLVRAIRSVAPSLDVRIKWPNDIYTADKIKIGGILCQSSFMDRVFDVVVGVGINVANDAPTTCLNALYRAKEGANATIPFTRESLVAAFLNQFEQDLPVFEKDGFEPFRDEYLKYWLHT